MKKLLVVQAVVSFVAGWTLVNSKVPIDKSVQVQKHELTTEGILREVKIQSARRDVERVLRDYDCSPDVLESVSRNAVDFHLRPRLLAAEVAVESGCREDALSPAGAIGLMQVEPRIWNMNQEDLRDPEINIRTGARILSGQIRVHGEREGIRRYFGVTPGSNASDSYAQLVEARATATRAY